MPRAGGSYIYASRGLNPYLGFVASFSQWFGLSIAIGVISYVIVPFIRDIASVLGWMEIAGALNTGIVRLILALVILWFFITVNIRGIDLYERTLIPLMVLMFALGLIVIVSGFIYNHQDFISAVATLDGRVIEPPPDHPFDLTIFLSASALLFSSFIGFDSIAQAGGEAKNPGRTLPLSIVIAMTTVSLFYVAFTYAMYHIVPWNFIASEAMIKDITAPGLIRYVLPAGWTVAIVTGAAVALTNDLPAMILSVSRLMFAWAEDGIFPARVAIIHPKLKTPHIAIILSGVMASIGILGSHFAGDFFLGIDIMVTSMYVNFLLMCVTVITVTKRNPEIAKNITVLKSPLGRNILGITGIIFLTGFLIIHVTKDWNASVSAWYFHSTPVWLIVMAFASLIYFYKVRKQKQDGINIHERFSKLPEE